jgi:hypothetical protein
MTEIRQLVASSAFSDLDRHFAAFIEVQAGRGSHPAGARPSDGAAATPRLLTLLSPRTGALLPPSDL